MYMWFTLTKFNNVFNLKLQIGYLKQTDILFVSTYIWTLKDIFYVFIVDIDGY